LETKRLRLDGKVSIFTLNSLVITLMAVHVAGCDSSNNNNNNSSRAPSSKSSPASGSRDATSNSKSDQDEDNDSSAASNSGKGNSTLPSASSRTSKSTSSNTKTATKETVEPTKSLDLDPGLIQTACVAPTIKGDAKKLVDFLKNPNAPGANQVSSADRKSALDAIATGKTAEDPIGLVALQAQLDQSCKK
jgi:hypothetical protein